MTIIKKENAPSNLTIDLTGPEGNAFVLLGYAKKLSKNLSSDPETTEKIINEMSSGDYENLVETFDAYFGNFVTLLR